jgi:CRISPR type IV-associated protein Csf3
MLSNWKLTVNLLTPVSERPPMLEALLMWELAKRLGLSKGEDLSKATPLSEIKELGIPLCKKTICDVDVFQCSNPIFKVEYEYHEHQAKRFECDKMAQLLDGREQKSLLTASGPYKMRFVPVRTMLIPKVVYFFRGDKKEVNKLLKSVLHIGRLRNIGYGRISHFEYEETEENHSIFSNGILMRTIPYYQDANIKGAIKSYGACKPPFWHPENYREVWEPC